MQMWLSAKISMNMTDQSLFNLSLLSGLDRSETPEVGLGNGISALSVGESSSRRVRMSPSDVVSCASTCGNDVKMYLILCGDASSSLQLSTHPTDSRKFCPVHWDIRSPSPDGVF